MAERPFDPSVVTEGYATLPGSPLTAGQVDLVHRTMNNPGRFVSEAQGGEHYFKNWTDPVSGVGTAGEFMETLAVAVMATQTDTFHLALGLPLRALPEPRPDGAAPAGALNPLAGPHASWVPTVRPSEAVGLVRTTYSVFDRLPDDGPIADHKVANIMKQLSALPADHARFVRQAMAMYFMQKRNGRALSGRQVELIAAMVSQRNDCAY